MAANGHFTTGLCSWCAEPGGCGLCKFHTVVATLETPRSPFKLLCHETSAIIDMVIRRHAMLQACVVHSVSAASMART